MADEPSGVHGGVDTHKDVHVAAAADQTGRVLTAASFAADLDRYRELRGRLGRAEPLVRVGIEGTGSYGAGLCPHLSAAGVEVVEVVRPDRQQGAEIVGVWCSRWAAGRGTLSVWAELLMLRWRCCRLCRRRI